MAKNLSKSYVTISLQLNKNNITDRILEGVRSLVVPDMAEDCLHLKLPDNLQHKK